MKAIVGISKIGSEMWGLAASLGLHALAVGVFLIVPTDRQVEAQAPESVLVEVVTPEQLEEAIQRERTSEQEPELEGLDIDLDDAKPAEKEPQKNQQLAALQPRQTKPQSNDPQTNERSTEPKEIIPGTPDGDINAPPIPGRVVAIPRARVPPKEREALSGDKLREKLCHDEAIARISKDRNDLKPDLIVSSAIDEAVTAQQIILANGAAFRSNDRWYQLKFRCEANAEEKTIVAFDFLIGDAFPQEELEVRPATTAVN